jgi:DNA-binding transcriptional regulator YiaG
MTAEGCQFPDPEVWEKRGNGWYRKGIASQDQNAHFVKVCAQCDKEFLGQRRAKFCSHACHADSLRGRVLTGNPSYRTAHNRVGNAKGRASGHACVDCGQPAAQWSYDGLDPDELTDPKTGCKYSAKPGHYQARCHLCHLKADKRFGETHASAKLTNAQIRVIRASTGVSDGELAEHFGVSRSRINQIRQRARNHGAGRGQATENTRELAQSWIDRARANGQDVTDVQLALDAQHDPLFDLGGVS